MAAAMPEAYWVKVVEEFEQSHLDRKGFAKERNIKLSMFKYWLYKIRRKRIAQTNEDSDKKFIRISLKNNHPEGTPGKMWLQFSADMSLHFETPPEPGYLAAVVKAFF